MRFLPSEVDVLFVFFSSMFGTVVIYRFLSLLEKVEVLNRTQLNLLAIFLQLFLWFLLFFKEHMYLTFIYIGTFLLILILSDKIISYFIVFSFEKLHLSIIQRLLVHISRGRSMQTGVKIVFNELSDFEKLVFADLVVIFEDSKSKTAPSLSLQHYFFNELSEIARSKTQISTQLTELKLFLSLRSSLRHRSRQILLQAKTQATVCVLIYIFFWFLTSRYLDLDVISIYCALSLFLFVVGFVGIFRIGSGFKWKT